MTTAQRNGSVTASVRDMTLDRLIEQITDELQAGGQIDLEAMVREHPEHAGRLRQLVPALALMANLGQSGDPSIESLTPSAVDSAPDSGVLGDYRIVREIGRGGMGVVYEAQQLSLNRRVALKVLPFAAVADPKQLQRFRIEAQAAAQLHHTNIVPVHAVGCERGVHYYAMQYVEGETLAHLISELRQLDGPKIKAEAHPSIAALDLAGRLASGQLTTTQQRGWTATGPPIPRPLSAPPPSAPPSSAKVARVPLGQLDSEPRFFLKAVRLGIQAAEALEHAHAQGVVHRDIKPANLLVDVQGNLWVTDFGLARLQSEAGLTMTGDLLGTLRYMSPEQASGQAGRDRPAHRHLLAGRDPLRAADAAAGFRGARTARSCCGRSPSSDPLPPRRRTRRCRAELETIVLKAMAKDPRARYATAQELADDLRRFLENKPIRAGGRRCWSGL